ncbi:response regulator [Candidatus Saccharibacteria bacterium]|nr:response regulator [Candidatus Saccharibacteria bacterium]MBI3338278.1 response regulator [Candidatus Saccharibacteria bacterium]
MNILLIEPHQLLASTYKQALEGADHSVAWCQKAQKALHLADNHVPDLVIMELQLQQHNGIAFLHEFRSYAEWQAIPVIVHSLVPFNHYRADKKNLESLGIVAYLYKPVTSIKRLLDAVDQISTSDLRAVA